ncbi:hypothetical protein IWZ00DRAFT_553403 [Phyllosticta capitalensis]
MEEQENLATINVVKNAIDNASADRLRILLKYVYALEREPEACARIESLLLFDERNHFFGPAGDEPKTESKDEWNDNPVSKGSIDDDLPDNLKAMLQHLAANDALAVIGRYRVDQLRGKRKRFAICSRCREDYDVKANSWNSCHWHDEYDVTLNKPDACIRHNGFLEPDEDHSVWDYWDDDKDGNRWEPYEKVAERYPQGYLWSCCDRRGTTKERCLSTPHLDKRSDPALKTSLKKQQEAYLEAKYFP